MNRYSSNFAQQLRELNNVFIGLDELFGDVPANKSYPPHDLIKNGNDYKVSVAVAGFTEDEISVVTENKKLVIKGLAATEEGEPEKVYIRRGIAKRAFTLTYLLTDYHVVTGADLKDGILTVHVKFELPEPLQPKKIAIATLPSTPDLIKSQSQ